MSNDPKDILANGDDKNIDDQQLINYLNNQLSERDQHALEKEMVENGFVNDAIEGLQQIEDKNNVEAYVQQLNIDLQKHLSKNRKRKLKSRLKEQPYTFFAIALMLLLFVVSFLIVKKYLDERPAPPPPSRSQVPPALNKDGTS